MTLKEGEAMKTSGLAMGVLAFVLAAGCVPQRVAGPAGVVEMNSASVTIARTVPAVPAGLLGQKPMDLTAGEIAGMNRKAQEACEAQGRKASPAISTFQRCARFFGNGGNCSTYEVSKLYPCKSPEDD